LQVGLAYQQTNRSSDLSFENINLNSLTANVGVELEVVKNLFVLGNVFIMNGSGNEILPERDSEGTIVNYQNYSVDGSETNISGGLRFNFSEDVYLAGIYETNSNTFIVDRNYTYNQFMVYYIMKF
jgi:hypothetical protein